MPKETGDQVDGDSKGSLLTQLLAAIPAAGAPVVVLGGILGGFFTPTEAAAAGVVYVILLGLIYRSFTIANFVETLKNATSTTASIMFIVVAAALFGWILAYERVPQAMAEAALSLTTNPFVFLIILNIILLIVGAILEPTAAILILVPVLAPMASVYGLDPVHMGIIIIFNLMIGLLTPPVGLVLFVLSSTTGYKISEIIKSVAPFYGIMILVLIAITFVPLILGMS